MTSLSQTIARALCVEEGLDPDRVSTATRRCGEVAGRIARAIEAAGPSAPVGELDDDRFEALLDVGMAIIDPELIAARLHAPSGDYETFDLRETLSYALREILKVQPLVPPRVGDGDAREAAPTPGDERWVNAEITLIVPLDSVSVEASASDKQDAVSSVMEQLLEVAGPLAQHVTAGRWVDMSEPAPAPLVQDGAREREAVVAPHAAGVRELAASGRRPRLLFVPSGARATVEQNVPPLGGYRVEVGGVVVVPETNSMSACEAAAAINAANGLAPDPEETR